MTQQARTKIRKAICSSVISGFSVKLTSVPSSCSISTRWNLFTH